MVNKQNVDRGKHNVYSLRMENFIAQEIDKFESPTVLSKLVGISAQRLINWRKRGRIPADSVLSYCEKRGWEVTPHMVRPDIYPHPSDGLPGSLRSEVIKVSA